ncbi:MAG: hypothetical protein Alpg2KO_19880 [Alphaproteobacteria bacterium]
MELNWIIPLLYAALLVVSICMSVQVVPEGYEYVIERLGKFHQVLKPGIGFIIPFADRVRARVHIAEVTKKIDAEAFDSADFISFRASARLDFQVVNAPRSVYQVANLDQSLSQLFTDSLRTELAKVKFADMNLQRDEIAGATVSRMLDKAEGWGLSIKQVTLQTISRDS